MIFKNEKDNFIIELSTGFCASFLSKKKGQTFLKRYVPAKHKFISIPLTRFCFVTHTEIKPDDTGWVMDWSVQPSKSNNLLFIEMNSTDVQGWAGNDDISGSFEMVLTVPDFLDSTTILLTSEKQQGLHFTNNIAHDAKTSFGSNSLIRLKKTASGILIAGDINMTSIKPNTKQQINFKNGPLHVFSLPQFHAYEKKVDKRREDEQKKMANDMVEYIMLRDSVSEVVNKKYNDSIEAHPYMGPLRFWISKVNKASYQRITYTVTQDSVEVKTGPYDFMYFAKNYRADKVMFVTKIDEQSLQELKSFKDTLETGGLKSYYDNTCMMDGLILVFQFEWEGKVIESNISNYYVSKIAPVIMFINKIVPESYHIWYDKKELDEWMKGCKIILD